jgi:ketosteroid isomerase-like protein
VDRDELVGTVRDYLAALDRLDLGAALGFFAIDAVFTIQSAHQVFEGLEAIERLWSEVLGAHSGMRHTVTNVVVDEPARKVVTEQTFRGELGTGVVEDRHSIYVFELDEAGLFSRVIVWIDGATPVRP